MNRKILPLSLFLVITLIGVAYAAEDDINLVNLPGQLATHWGISTFAAGLFLASLVTFAFLLPFLIWRKSGLLVLLVGFSVMGFCISIGWLPYWIMLLLVLMIASLWASKITKSL